MYSNELEGRIIISVELILHSFYVFFRCFFGSDWPVCRTATGIVDYPDVVKLLEDLLKDRSVEERKLIFQDNAITFYGLQDVVDL
jgi:predicted TIM-barrel fold metal-dependent hydrolase